MRKDEFPIVDKFVKDSINEVLDKIRAEIEQMNNPDYVEPVTVDEVMQIIDKYRAESEEKQDEDKI
jgi:hypothetical protein